MTDNKDSDEIIKLYGVVLEKYAGYLMKPEGEILIKEIEGFIDTIK